MLILLLIQLFDIRTCRVWLAALYHYWVSLSIMRRRRTGRYSYTKRSVGQLLPVKHA